MGRCAFSDHQKPQRLECEAGTQREAPPRTAQGARNRPRHVSALGSHKDGLQRSNHGPCKGKELGQIKIHMEQSKIEPLLHTICKVIAEWAIDWCGY